MAISLDTLTNHSRRFSASKISINLAKDLEKPFYAIAILMLNMSKVLFNY